MRKTFPAENEQNLLQTPGFVASTSILSHGESARTALFTLIYLYFHLAAGLNASQVEVTVFRAHLIVYLVLAIIYYLFTFLFF